MEAVQLPRVAALDVLRTRKFHFRREPPLRRVLIDCISANVHTKLVSRSFDVAQLAHELLQLRHLRQIWAPRNRMSHPYPPRLHFTAPINAFSVSIDGQQQRSTPLFGSGAWAIDVNQHRPAGHWHADEQIGFVVIDDDRWGKDFGLCRLRRGAETSNASALVALSDVFAGGVVEAVCSAVGHSNSGSNRANRWALWTISRAPPASSYIVPTPERRAL